jgi:hypothetical protein
MEKNKKDLLSKEYGLELIGFVLDELSKIPGFDRLEMIKRSHDFVVNEYKKDASMLLPDDEESEYTDTKNRLSALLLEKKEQIVKIIDVENLSSLLKSL